METKYVILRFYCPSLCSEDVRKVGLTLEEAQAHCRREDTHESGKWFDGYEKQTDEHLELFEQTKIGDN